MRRRVLALWLAVLQLAGEGTAAARLLIAREIPQTADFRLAFAEALRRGDDDTLVSLWSGSAHDEAELLRLIQVYCSDAKSQQQLTVGLLKRMLPGRG